jgi:hypothetical protein
VTVLRRAELIVLSAGLLVALVAVSWVSRGAFQANMGSLKGAVRLLAFFTTLASFFIVGGIVIAPYAILYFLGKRIAGDGSLLAFLTLSQDSGPFGYRDDRHDEGPGRARSMS